jgi:hypothetical protein
MMMAATIHTDAQTRVQEELDDIAESIRRRLCILFVQLLTEIAPDI